MTDFNTIYAYSFYGFAGFHGRTIPFPSTILISSSLTSGRAERMMKSSSSSVKS